MHASESEPDCRFTIESIRKGDGCSYIVTGTGHGEAHDRQAVDTKEEIPAVLSGMVARWVRYCEELKNTVDGRTVVAGDAVIGADDQ